ncbi:MAG: ABC-2 family transporter protein [Leptospiraceae bacterium]|nr:ABC-2 family transporter protein [Leptospiraceae bacterium]
MFAYLSQIYSLELRRLLTYRAEFWIYFFGNLAGHMLVAYFLWDAIFKFNGVSEMRGFTFRGIMLYYLLVPVVDGVIRGMEMTSFSREIYDGTLNRYLLYPVSFFAYKIASRLAESTLALLQLGLAFVLYLILVGVPDGVSVSLFHVLSGVGLCLLAFLVYFCMASTLELLAFWADNVWSLLVLLRFLAQLLGGGLIPLVYFPDWSIQIIQVLPFGYLISLPIRTFLGMSTTAEIFQGAIMLVAWLMVLSFPVAYLWNRGLRRYSGIGI